MTSESSPPTEPADLAALAELADREHLAGRLAEATAAYRRLLAIRPDLAEAHNNLGLVLWRQAERGQAVACFLRALALQPGLADAHQNLGNALLAEGKLDEAAARYRQVIALRPDQAEAYHSLGTVFCRQGQLTEAAAHFERAVALKPAFAKAHDNLGSVLRQQGRLDEAVARLRQAVALDPTYPSAHFNLGYALWCQGELDEAARQFEQAIALRPSLLEAHFNLGCVLRDQRKLTAALAAFQRLRTHQPNSPRVHMAEAHCHLLAEDYERGWQSLEGRIELRQGCSPAGPPRWTGEPLAGRSVLLLAEQGFGDTIHFFRYARLLKKQGARVVLACQAALAPLLASQPDCDGVLVADSATQLPQTDFYLPLLSAPGVFRTGASTIPSEVPYLVADAKLTEQWRDELATIDRIKIGIAWQGARDHLGNRWRSMPLACFAPLARLPGVQLISLQKGFGSEQIAQIDFPVLDLADRLDEATGPFMDTAAVIRNLDLVVTTDSAVAHLAGALGAAVFLALHFSSDWRWLRDRDDSAWYPTMRLFRQSEFGRWEDVFERIAAAVAAKMAEESP